MVKAVHEAKRHSSWINPDPTTITPSASSSIRSWTSKPAGRSWTISGRFRAG